MVVTMVPSGVVSMKVGIEPWVIPHVTIVLPTIVIAPMMSPMEAMMIGPRIAPRTPAKRVAHHVVPIVPIARGGKHISIHAVVVDIPIPTGPQGTAIDHIPVERTAYGNGIARIAETDDAHGILIVRVAAIEAVHPTLTILHTGKAQSVGIHP